MWPAGRVFFSIINRCQQSCDTVPLLLQHNCSSILDPWIQTIWPGSVNKHSCCCCWGPVPLPKNVAYMTAPNSKDCWLSIRWFCFCFLQLSQSLSVLVYYWFVFSALSYLSDSFLCSSYLSNSFLCSFLSIRLVSLLFPIYRLFFSALSYLSDSFSLLFPIYPTRFLRSFLSIGLIFSALFYLSDSSFLPFSLFHSFSRVGNSLFGFLCE